MHTIPTITEYHVIKKLANFHPIIIKYIAWNIYKNMTFVKTWGGGMVKSEIKLNV